MNADLARSVAQQLMVSDVLAAHARDELGHRRNTGPSPAGGTRVRRHLCRGRRTRILTILVAPATALVPAVSAVPLLCLVGLGAVAARAGGAPAAIAAGRVAFWGALAMAATAAVGKLFGTTVG